MNYKLILRLLGRTLLLEAACMLLPLLVSVFYGESVFPFALSILIVAGAGFLLAFLPTKGQFYTREGFVVVAAIWILFCLFGALPFYFSGYFEGFINCLFEAVSGFTTTGATILKDVEVLPRGLLFWRSFTSWLGGMGVLIFTLAFLPTVGGRTQNLVWAESTGPVTTKLVPKTARSSQILYLIYMALTGAEVLCLRLAGMPWFDSILHSFTTICTGGFSMRNASIGAYESASIEIIITVFILLSSVNFALYFLLMTKRFSNLLKSDELRWFLGFVALASVLITLNLHFTKGSIETGSLWETFRHGLFQVSSIISTTGFATVDFDFWPEFSRIVLVILMFIGGCAGSTAGGMKVARILLLVRCIGRDVRKISHPRAVKVVKLDGNAVDEFALSRVSTFFVCYGMVIAVTCLIVALDNFSFSTTVTAVISSVGNVGPGLGTVGPMGNFAAFSPLSKLSLSACMLIGRLEIFPILILLSPSTWKHS